MPHKTKITGDAYAAMLLNMDAISWGEGETRDADKWYSSFLWFLKIFQKEISHGKYKLDWSRFWNKQCSPSAHKSHETRADVGGYAQQRFCTEGVAHLSKMTWPAGAVMFHVQFAPSVYAPMKLGVSMMLGLVTWPPQAGNIALSIQRQKWFGTGKQLELCMSTVRVL
jgi:hypothetical protein